MKVNRYNYFPIRLLFHFISLHFNDFYFLESFPPKNKHPSAFIKIFISNLDFFREEIQQCDEQFSSPLLRTPEFHDYRVVSDMDWRFGVNNKCELGARIIIKDLYNRNLGREYSRVLRTANSDQIRYLCLFCIKKEERKNTVLLLNVLDNGFKVVLEPLNHLHADYCKPRQISFISEKQIEFGGNKIPEFYSKLESVRIVPKEEWILGFNRNGIANGRLIILERNNKTMCREYGIQFRGRKTENDDTQSLKCTYYCTTCSGKKHSCAYLIDVHNEKRVVTGDAHSGVCIPKSLEFALEKQKENEEIYKKNLTKRPEIVEEVDSAAIPDERWYWSPNKKSFYIISEDNRSTAYYYTKTEESSNNYFFKCVSCDKSKVLLQISESGEIVVNAELPHPRYCKPKPFPPVSKRSERSRNIHIEKNNSDPKNTEKNTTEESEARKRSEHLACTSEPPPKKKPVEQQEPTVIVNEKHEKESNAKSNENNIIKNNNVNFEIEKPSSSWLKSACKTFGIPPTDQAYSVWSEINIKSLKSSNPPEVKKSKKFDSGFKAVSYLISGTDSHGQIIKNQVNKFFFDNFNSLGVVGDQNFANLNHTDDVFKNTVLSDDVTGPHLASISKMLNCQILILKSNKKKLKHYGALKNDSPTILLGKSHKEYSVIFS